MLKRRSVLCCSGRVASAALRSAQDVNQNAKAENRPCRRGGADGPCGQRQFAELFTRWKVGELHFQHERDATGVGGAGRGRISANDHQRR